MKKMLMIYPNNFLQGAMGTNNRVGQLVRMFRKIGFEIDYLGYEHFSQNSTFENFDQLNTDGIIHKLFIYDFNTGYNNAVENQQGHLQILAEKIKSKIIKGYNKQYLQDWVPEGMQRYFTEILDNNNYDVIIMFYTYFANLLANRKIKAKKVYFMEDSMFIQQYTWDRDSQTGITIGKLLDEEIERLQLFDEIFCISNDEKIFYEKVTGRYMHFLPHILPLETKIVSKPIENRRWDVFFIGFNNPFNTEGLKWFLEKVYPLLQVDIKILLAGSMTEVIEVKYDNIDIIPYVPDLDEIYEDVKVVICPMFRGTGMKIKVVEAMVKGLPVVCTERGVDGLPDKYMNGCLVAQEPQIFAECINKLLWDVDFYRDVVGNLKKYYVSVFDYEKYIKMLKQLLVDN